MGLLSIEVLCSGCGESYGMLVDRDARNEPQDCERCEGGKASRIWSVPNVSTSKTSESIPEVASRGRFNHHRRQRELQTEISRAKQDIAAGRSAGRIDDLKRLRTEKKKLDKK